MEKQPQQPEQPEETVAPVATDKRVVLYKGMKQFWRTRTNVDIVICEHKDSRVVEIVTYEPVLDMEAPRLYLDDGILYSKLDQSQLEESLKSAKELLLRLREVPDKEALMREIGNKAKVEYILNRLTVDTYAVGATCPGLKSFRVGFKFNFRDEDGDKQVATLDKMIVQKPAELKNFVTKNFRSLV
jgi:hypothetical protein